jgi:putative DNA primase/helicase
MNIHLSTLLKDASSFNARQQAGKGPEDKFNRTEQIVSVVGLLLERASLLGVNLSYANDGVYVYDGSHHIVLDKEDFKNFLGEYSHTIGIRGAEASYFLFRGDLLRQFESTAYRTAPLREPGTTLIPLRNGTLEITATKQNLRPHRQEDFLTYLLPFDYDPAAVPFLFKAFMDQVLPDKDLQSIIQEYVGSGFIPSGMMRLEKLLMLHGSGANGKSVLLSIISAMVGRSNISEFSLDKITDEAGYYRAQAQGKLFNIRSETPRRIGDNVILKQWASGEPIAVRHPYRPPAMMENPPRLIFSSNELPVDVEHSDGFFRRWAIIPFNVTIPEAKQDRSLAARIIASELSGVLNWVLQGLQRLQRQGGALTDSPVMRDQIAAFRKQSDTVLSFLSDCGWQRSRVNYRPLKEVYTSYRLYCEESGHRPCSISTFSQRLKSAGYEARRIAQGNVIYI